jgi:hypothetical protein
MNTDDKITAFFDAYEEGYNAGLEEGKTKVQKLTEANRILRDGLEYYSREERIGTSGPFAPNEAKQALEQADKIMEGGEG